MRVRGVAGYAALVGAVLGLSALAVELGSSHTGKAASASHPASAPVPSWHLIAAIGGIVLLCRAGGWLARRARQPPVIGQIVMGLLLGPSLLEGVAPRLTSRLLPPGVREQLGAFATVGVALFVFGMALDLSGEALRHRGRIAAWVSHASIALPFVGGCFLALLLPARLGPQGAFAPFCLFLGAAMSVTALPVLARILEETGLIATSVGQLAILCAAVDDVTVWLILSFVVAIARSGGWAPTLRTMALSALLVVVVLGPVRRLLNSVGNRPGHASPALAAGVALLASASSDWIGLHAIFGAFLAGCAMPRDGPLRRGAQALAPLTKGVLLPIFFVLSGFQVDLRELWSHPSELVAGALILLVAIGGKLIGATVAALWSGSTRPDALKLGVLMNTRGLTELVVLGVGFQLGVLSRALYTLLVVMALVTTAMTAPLLRALGVQGSRAPDEAVPDDSASPPGEPTPSGGPPPLRTEPELPSVAGSEPTPASIAGSQLAPGDRGPGGADGKVL
jgi:Kef-type K+ transport system membrane component KefB